MQNNYGQGYAAADRVHVNDYSRDDGTHVSSYWRAKPGHGVTLTGGVSYDDVKSTVAWNTPLSMLNEPYLFGKGGILTEINNRWNTHQKDAADLMNFSVWGTNSLPSSKYHKVIDSSFNDNLSKELKINIPQNMNGVIFSNDSSLASSISNNHEFATAVIEQMKGGFKNQQFGVTFNSWADPNLFRGLHNATVINPHIDKDGYFNAVVYDKYDFAWLDGAYQNPINAANNAAYLLQQMGRLENYYILVPIRTKL